MKTPKVLDAVVDAVLARKPTPTVLLVRLQRLATLRKAQLAATAAVDDKFAKKKEPA